MELFDTVNSKYKKIIDFQKTKYNCLEIYGWNWNRKNFKYGNQNMLKDKKIILKR